MTPIFSDLNLKLLKKSALNADKMNNEIDSARAPPLEVRNLLNIRSHIVLPVLLVISSVANLLCLKIINRKKLKRNSISLHLKYVIAVDLLTNLAYVPQMFYEENCIQISMAVAWYKAHLGAALIYYLRSLTMHLLCSLTLDRLLGITCNNVYQKSIRYTKAKLGMGWAYVTAMCLPGLCLGTINKVNGKWVITSIRNIINNPGLETYKSVVSIILILIPSLFLFIMSLVITVKIYQMNRVSKKNSRYRRNACAVLLLNASFIIIMVLHMTIKLLTGQDKQYCYSNYYRELWLLGTEVMSLMWSVVNVVVFLIICREYKHEVLISMTNWNLHHRPRPEAVQLRRFTYFTV